MRIIVIAGLLLMRVALADPLPQSSSIDHGRIVFERLCAPCHGQGPGNDGAPLLPGTAALQARYKNALPAALEKRIDLDAARIRLLIRSGAGAMPMFRKTEISDADVEAIAAYLKASSGAARN